MMAIGLPVSCVPTKGEFFDLECNSSTVHFSSGKKSVRQALEFLSIEESDKSKMALGLFDKRSIVFSSPNSGKWVLSTAKLVSNPTIPKCAYSNSTIL